MDERIDLWLRALRAGVQPLDTLTRWIAVAVLLLGIAGVTVTLVLHLPWPLITVILMGILLAIVAEGSFRLTQVPDEDARVVADAIALNQLWRLRGVGQQLQKEIERSGVRDDLLPDDLSQRLLAWDTAVAAPLGRRTHALEAFESPPRRLGEWNRLTATVAQADVRLRSQLDVLGGAISDWFPR